MTSKRSAYLVDGHHVFLAIYDQMQEFFNLLSEPEYLSANPFLAFQISSFEEVFKRPAAEVLRQKFRSIDYVSYAFRFLLIPCFSFYNSTAVDALEMYWFDAKLPSKDEAKKKLKKRIEEAGFDNGKAFDWYRYLNEDKWLFVDGITRIVPYGLKNEFINQLKFSIHFPGDIKTELGQRVFSVSQKLFVSSKEKGVDTRLAIQACDIAADPNVVEAVLISSDTDYIPVVERLKRGGRPTKVFSLSSFSDDFWKMLGPDYSNLSYVLNSQAELKDAKEIFGESYASKIKRCPIASRLAAAIGDELISIAETGDTVALSIRKQSLRAFTERFPGSEFGQQQGAIPEY